jgi:hypothetical protein
MASVTSYCHKCGTQLPGGATFCPKCGAAVAVSAASQAGPQQWTTRRGERAEKYEKQEKREKSEKGEKGSTAGGMLGALIGGLILIWLGATFFLEQNGYLPTSDWWAYFVAGVGAILVLEGVVIYSEGRRGFGPVIGGAILLLIGLSSISAYQLRLEANLWPLLLVALGVVVILGGLAARRRVPAP